MPAALELEIGEKEAKALKVKVIAEGANGPTYPEAEPILLDRGIDVLPDILVNSGGVMVVATTSGCRTSARSAGTSRRSSGACEAA